MELLVCIKQHLAAQSPIATPLRVSACSLASMMLWAEPRMKLMLECRSVAFAAVGVSCFGRQRQQRGLVLVGILGAIAASVSLQ